jgi:hypothetical protein
MDRFKLDQFRKESVKFPIGEFGLTLGVIEVIGAVDLVAELFDSFFDVRGRGHQWILAFRALSL